jgi:hypothetical protein
MTLNLDYCPWTSELDTNTRSWSDGPVTNMCSADLLTPDGPGLLLVEPRTPAYRGRARFELGGREVGSPALRPMRGEEVRVGERTIRMHPTRPLRAECEAPRTHPSHSARLRGRILLGIMATALVVVLALPWGGAGGRPLATSGPARAGAVIAPHELYIVQPGDTLWGIAQRLAPNADPRSVEAQLAAEVGGDTVLVGQRLVLP